MPRYSKLSRPKAFCDAHSINAVPILDFLLPGFQESKPTRKRDLRQSVYTSRRLVGLESKFYSALSQASVCTRHKISYRHGRGETFGTSRAHLSTHHGLKQINQYTGEPRARKYEQEAESERARRNGTQSSAVYGFFDSNEQQFAARSHLPQSFFKDIDFIRNLVPPPRRIVSKEPRVQRPQPEAEPGFDEQLHLLRSMRDLEDKLARAKRDLDAALARKSYTPHSVTTATSTSTTPIVLTKNDYLDLVDLYFYSHNSRFSPESTDSSPTPLFLEDYSFTLSADFSRGLEESYIDDDNNNGNEQYESPLRHVEELLKNRQLNEIASMQRFVDLLLHDKSSSRTLYEAYMRLPEPGVSYLPKGIIRIFLQRMSTPWTKSEKSMLRYLSLIDDMQKAKLPITSAEWSSAIYLAGRSFAKVTSSDLTQSFGVWRRMENEAGVKSHNVTFNILFDIAVRAGKFALGDTILKEMHQRNLRLNRLGRVSLIYYHGLRGDGDGVRKAYRDFVEAGEIVDTVVLNCVIASLINAQEPVAAEQTYQRMKDMQTRLRKDVREDGTEIPFKKYPDPESNQLDSQMASRQLGRILAKAPHLQATLPGQHTQLQSSMPLRPDLITFRTMLSYHASVSGDLDRLTVLLNDMTELFQIPLQSIVFQFLFKGFAIHGPAGGPDTAWSKKRLDLCWQACMKAIKDTQKGSDPSSSSPDRSTLALPTSKEVNNIPASTLTSGNLPAYQRQRQLSSWDQFIIDLAVFPRERLKRIQRFHSQMLDNDEDTDPRHVSRIQPNIDEAQDPFLQESRYSAPEQRFDHEEGEYVLPNPASSTLLNPRSSADRYDDDGIPYPTQEDADSSDEGTFNNNSHHSPGSGNRDIVQSTINVHATRPLVCWLLRAYARNTNSRRQVEEVWDGVRKLWKPFDAAERDGVIRVLRRCLRDCDQVGGN